MFGEITRTKEIIITFAKYGFIYYLRRIPRLQRFIPKKIKIKTSLPEGLRNALESLGPTFIKIGQLLSCRIDILPKDVIDELAKLQDEVNPLPFNIMWSVVEKELGKRVKFIDSFEKEPIASASLSQVYKGKVYGKNVVFKVKRPNIKRIIQEDFTILFQVAKMLENHISEVKWVKPSEIVSEMRVNIMKELNFIGEVNNINSFREVFAYEPDVIFPETFPELCTENLIVMSEIKGVKITDVQDESKRKELAAKGTGVVLRQIFDVGFFHGDPHPGNILITDDDKIAFLDFGLVGRIDPSTKELLRGIVLAIVEGDTFYMYRIIKQLGVLTSGYSISEVEHIIKSLLSRYLSMPLKEIDTRDVINEVSKAFRRLKIKLPLNLLILGKTLSQLEGIAEQLDPEFSLSIYLKPYIIDLYKEGFLEKNIKVETIKALRKTAETVSSLPKIIYYIQDWLDRGKLFLHIEKLEDVQSSIEKASTRIVIGMITAALIIGSALIVRGARKFTPFGIGGFVIAGIFGAWFLYRMVRYKEY